MRQKTSWLFAVLTIAAIATTFQTASAIDVFTDPVGFYRVPCFSNADTAVSMPFTRIPEFRGIVASTAGNVITVSNSPGWTANQWVLGGSVSNSYYVVVTTNVTGTMEGAYYVIGTNSASTLTVTGLESLTGVLAGDRIQIIPFWTLGTAFPGGQGVVISPSVAAQKTTLRFFSDTAKGVNLAPGGGGNYIYLGTSNFWVKTTALNVNANNVIIGPNENFIIRNQFTGGGMLTTTNISPGAVSLYPARIALFANPSGPVASNQDNTVSINRPAIQTLNQSGLNSNNFQVSTVTATRDQVFVYSYPPTAVNNAPGGGGRYLLLTNGWRKTTALAVDAGTSNVFQVGQAFIIRRVTNAITQYNWANNPNYSN